MRERNVGSVVLVARRRADPHRHPTATCGHRAADEPRPGPTGGGPRLGPRWSGGVAMTFAPAAELIYLPRIRRLRARRKRLDCNRPRSTTSPCSSGDPELMHSPPHRSISPRGAARVLLPPSSGAEMAGAIRPSYVSHGSNRPALGLEAAAGVICRSCWARPRCRAAARSVFDDWAPRSARAVGGAGRIVTLCAPLGAAPW